MPRTKLGRYFPWYFPLLIISRFMRAHAYCYWKDSDYTSSGPERLPQERYRSCNRPHARTRYWHGLDCIFWFYYHWVRTTCRSTGPNFSLGWYSERPTLSTVSIYPTGLKYAYDYIHTWWIIKYHSTWSASKIRNRGMWLDCVMLLVL